MHRHVAGRLVDSSPARRLVRQLDRPPPAAFVGCSAGDRAADELGPRAEPVERCLALAEAAQLLLATSSAHARRDRVSVERRRAASSRRAEAHVAPDGRGRAASARRPSTARRLRARRRSSGARRSTDACSPIGARPALWPGYLTKSGTAAMSARLTLGRVTPPPSRPEADAVICGHDDQRTVVEPRLVEPARGRRPTIRDRRVRPRGDTAGGPGRRASVSSRQRSMLAWLPVVAQPGDHRRVPVATSRRKHAPRERAAGSRGESRGVCAGFDRFTDSHELQTAEPRVLDEGAPALLAAARTSPRKSAGNEPSQIVDTDVAEKSGDAGGERVRRPVSRAVPWPGRDASPARAPRSRTTRPSSVKRLSGWSAIVGSRARSRRVARSGSRERPALCTRAPSSRPRTRCLRVPAVRSRGTVARRSTPSAAHQGADAELVEDDEDDRCLRRDVDRRGCGVRERERARSRRTRRDRAPAGRRRRRETSGCACQRV